MTSNPQDPFDYPGKPVPIDRDELLRLIQDNKGPWRLDLSGRVFLADPLASDWYGSSPMDLRLETLEQLKASHRPDQSGHFWWLVHGGINLAAADLHGSWLPGTFMEGADLARADLRGSSLFGTHLEGALLSYADLRGATINQVFLQGAQLPFAKLQGTRLDDVDLREADLGWAELEQVDMYRVYSLEGAKWHGAHLDHTRIKRESLGKAIGEELEAHRYKGVVAYREASEAYLLLKNNFNQIGRYEDASWAYVKGQQMEKMALYWEWRGQARGLWHVWRSFWPSRLLSGLRLLHRDGWRAWWSLRPPAWGPFWRWFWNRAFEFLTGHGEEPLKAVRAGVFTILGFAVGFTRAIGNFWDALVYSIATFATFNLARLEPQGRGMEIASSLEAILGISVLALVVFTLGNRMSRG